MLPFASNRETAWWEPARRRLRSPRWARVAVRGQRLCVQVDVIRRVGKRHGLAGGLPRPRPRSRDERAASHGPISQTACPSTSSGTVRRAGFGRSERRSAFELADLLEPIAGRARVRTFRSAAAASPASNSTSAIATRTWEYRSTSSTPSARVAARASAARADSNLPSIASRRPWLLRSDMSSLRFPSSRLRMAWLPGTRARPTRGSARRRSPRACIGSNRPPGSGRRRCGRALGPLDYLGARRGRLAGREAQLAAERERTAQAGFVAAVIPRRRASQRNDLGEHLLPRGRRRMEAKVDEREGGSRPRRRARRAHARAPVPR